MDENTIIRKSFWRRSNVKLPGSVRIVPIIQGENGGTIDEPHLESGVLDARFSYTSLVTKPQPRSEQPLAPITTSQYPTASFDNTTNDNSNQQSTTLVHSTSSPPPPKKSLQKHQPTSSTAPHKKTFNAFLEDTNEEWNDSMEDNKKDKPTAAPKVSTAPIPDNSTTTTTTAIAPTFLVPELEQDLIINKLTLAEPESTTTSVATYKKSSNINGVIDNVLDVLKDPTFILRHIEPDEKAQDYIRIKKMKDILCSPNVDLVALRGICWSGIPPDFRLIAWQLLLGYLPCNSERRMKTLARKRKEYLDSVKATYAKGTEGLDQTLWHQIHIDILRTNPGVFLYQSSLTQECLERILYQWAIRHPASGYVQGINDLVTPIFEVFLSAYIDTKPEEYDMNKLNQNVLDVVEADSFWCLSKLLDGIQDNYTFAQPGIQRQIVTLKDLVSRIDARLASHLQQEGIEFIQFAFRWMNCLLMRELPLKNTIRMWDTYLAEGSSEGFSEFHVYVCAAFLVKWSTQLQTMDFQEIMIFLQQLPTEDWQEKDVELLLSEAYMWKTLFHNAPSHLKNK
ncbi:rab-GTPase-TBC domain-containing protein [Chlamydoabsidia padenii]|nr:rab-GTPase-TBC domain-containing protein [Chlamydoabsidia padenii]